MNVLNLETPVSNLSCEALQGSGSMFSATGSTSVFMTRTYFLPAMGTPTNR